MKSGVAASSCHTAIRPVSGGNEFGGGSCERVSELSHETRRISLTSYLVPSAIHLWIPIPTPSITARKMPHIIAPFRAALHPPLIANDPPVKNPAMMELYGSSFFRIPLTAQSYVLNIPPQTPKFPPVTGARALIAVIAPILRSPYGEFLNPLMPCHIEPPIAPIENAPPKSDKATQGQGSRE